MFLITDYSNCAWVQLSRCWFWAILLLAISEIHVQPPILTFLASQPSFGSLSDVNVLHAQTSPLTPAPDELESIAL